MNTTAKDISLLIVSDFERNPIWEFSDRDEDGEMLVRPVGGLPVTSLDHRVVGVQVVLANGQSIWALLANIDLRNPRATKHFLGLSAYKNGHWIALARYHDVDYSRNGPQAFADSLGLTTNDVFPIAYDVSPYALGDADAVKGVITDVPVEKLSDAQLIDLALNG